LQPHRVGIGNPDAVQEADLSRPPNRMKLTPERYRTQTSVKRHDIAEVLIQSRVVAAG